MPRQILSKQKIIETSVSLIESGSELSFSLVAQQLGTRSQALYSYFSNQQELSYCVVAWAINQVSQQLQQKIFGQTGIKGIIALATEFRSLALKHFKLTQLVLKMPRTNAYPEVTAAFEQLRSLINQLLATEYSDPKQQLLASRYLRDLTIGDIVNVGTGWFADKSLPADKSFPKMLEQVLKNFAN